ncbi:MAG: STAS domain-containing protein [Candidatus Sulfotelmatobacter sp.]
MLKLNLQTRSLEDVMIVHCQGRIVYRDEAAALSRLVGQVIEDRGKVLLDLSGISFIDGAGMGELVLLHTWAQSRNAELRCASPSPLVRELLDITNLNSVLEIHTDLNEAMAAFQSGAYASEELCTDC